MNVFAARRSSTLVAVAVVCVVAQLEGGSIVQAATSHSRSHCLPAKNMSGEDYSGCTIVRANMAGANARGANFLRSSFLNTALNGASFQRANLSQLRTSGVTGSPVFTPTDPYEVRGGYIVGANTNLSGARLSGTSLSGVSLGQAVLDGASFIGTSFTRTRLDHENFTAAHLGGADNFSGSTWTSVIIGPGTDLHGVLFEGVRISASTLAGADLAGAQFAGATLTGDDLRGAAFYAHSTYKTARHASATSRPTAAGASDFSYATITSTHFDTANLIGATFFAATVTGSSSFAGARLAYANLSGATFSGHTSLQGADLSHAVLDGATFHGANLTGARFSAGALSAHVRFIDVVCPDGTSSSSKANRSTCAGHYARSSHVARGVHAAAPACPTSPPTAATARHAYAGCVLRGVRWHGCSLHATARGATPDFAGTTFIDANLSGCNLSFGDFEGAVFERSNLGASSLAYADLAGATVDRSSLLRADLRDATFLGASIARTDLSRTYLSGGPNLEARPTGVSFAKAYLFGDRLVGVTLHGAAIDFHGAFLVHSTVVAAYLSGGADFRGATISGTRIKGSNLEFDRFMGASLLDGSSLSGVRLGGSNWSKSVWRAVGASGVTVAILGRPRATRLPTGWVLTGGRLLGPSQTFTHVVARSANLTGVDLGNASLPGARLEHANLRGVVADGVALRGASLSGANLAGAYLIGAHLRGATLVGANLAGADLSDADLSHVDLLHAVVTQTTRIPYVVWNDTICPDGTNSNANGHTCARHFVSSDPPPVLEQTGPSAVWVSTWSTGSAFASQLTVAHAVGQPDFVVTAPNAHLAVSATGVVTTNGGPLAVGSYLVRGVSADDAGDAGQWAFALHVKASTITQTSPTSPTVDQDDTGSWFADQLAVSGASGAATYAVSTADSHLNVSASGAVSTLGGPIELGTYLVAGTVTDALGDVGTWRYSLTVTSEPSSD